MIIGGHKSTKLRDAQEKHKKSMNSTEAKNLVRKKWKNGGSWEYRQGKTTKQMNDSELNALIGCIGLGVVILGIIIWGIIHG
jgi:hypothetical protein